MAVVDRRISDEVLLARIAARDACGLEMLATRFSALIRAVAYRTVGDWDIADDVLQEALLKIWQSASGYDVRRGSARTWIVAVVRHAAIDTRRRIAVRTAAETAYKESLRIALRPVWASGVERAGDEWIKAALVTLPPEQRRAIIMVYIDGNTHMEIAAQLGLPLGTVKARIRYGIAKIRTAVGESMA